VNYDGLPGYEIVRDGLRDLSAGRRTPSALLVLIGAPRLRDVGIEVPPIDISDPDHKLYEMLALEDADSAHSRYNALIRQLVSFERAAECAV